MLLSYEDRFLCLILKKIYFVFFCLFRIKVNYLDNLFIFIIFFLIVSLFLYPAARVLAEDPFSSLIIDEDEY